jgi:hypothetical protein
MSWYYAGPDAKPVGPLTLEELHARRATATISPETYVIEYVGAPGDARAWKRYKELFPAASSLPPLPPPATPAIPAAHTPPPFLSAATAPAHVPPPVPAPISPHISGYPPAFPNKKTNPWCTWGFGLGLASLVLLLPSCGIASLLIVPAIFVSLVGLIKVQHEPAQPGRNLAITGIVLSGAALLLTVVILALAIPALLKGHGLITTTETSTTDSE